MQSHKAERVKTDAVTTDPVCGMKVDPATARHSHIHDGITYYFCCEGCRAKFVAAPAKY
ncbi:MAG: YHS domain-containing protein, partial [Candidatus Binataceae bacterium]